ncbi:MAG: hypothetical protein HQ474_00005 [Flammeovirgaceae bacterium]|nr:hypothetical protein [Flammeovirgaceae bacterium]
MNDFREQCRSKLEAVLISHKAKNKVVTRNINKIKIKNQVQTKIALTPRGQLHKETIYGKIRVRKSNEVKIGASFDSLVISQVANQSYREALLKRLGEHNSDPKKAFSGSNSLIKNPVYTMDKERVPERVKLTWFEDQYVIRKEINPTNFSNLKQIEKIVDQGIKRKLIKRLELNKGNAKEAFSNLDDNPIFLDNEGTIPVKAARIKGVNNAEGLHNKYDHFGKLILDKIGNTMDVDFVSLGNNHHIAVYQDENGKLQEMVVSFFEAVRRSNSREDIIDKTYNEHLGWKFLFTMKQNEMFIFPSDSFDPNGVDLMNPLNYSEISKNMFRVQKIAVGDYVFRHHLETEVIDNPKFKGVIWKRIGLSSIKNIIKIRINHLGRIVEIGEY